MPIFRCEQCGCYENTALSNYWTRDRDEHFEKIVPAPPALCSACDPDIRQWHGKFEQRSADGMLVGENGFLYHDRLDAEQLRARIRGVIVDGTEQPISGRQLRMQARLVAAKGGRS